jgi:hypothetical protein
MPLCYHFFMSQLKGLFAAVIFLLGSVAQGQELACHESGKPMLRAEIYFGRNIGGRLGVSERQWTEFLARELTARFPDGLTVIDGQGQWRGPSGAIVREPSKIVIVFVADEAPTRARIAAAAPPPQQRFQQDSVAVVTRAVCVAF